MRAALDSCDGCGCLTRGACLDCGSQQCAFCMPSHCCGEFATRGRAILILMAALLAGGLLGALLERFH